MNPSSSRCHPIAPLLLILVGCLPGALALAQAPAVSPAPSFLQELEKAANRGGLAELQKLTAPGIRNDYRWAIAPPSMMGAHKPWQVKVLTLPTPEGAEEAKLLAFYRYQHAESQADHLYILDGSSGGPLLGAELAETDTLGVRVRDHHAALRFDVPRKQVAIRDRVRMERKSGPYAAAILRLNSIYTVASVTQAGKPLPFRQAGGFLAIAAPPAGEISLDVTYRGTVNVSTEDYILPDQAGLTSYWLPHTGRLPVTSTITMTVPRGWQAIAVGEPTGKSLSADGKTTSFTWQNRMPVCYPTMAAGKYEVTTRKFGDVSVSAYTLPRHGRRTAEEGVRAAGSAIQWFSKSFSPYPYKRYAVVATDSFPSALECYSFTLCKAELIPVAVVHEVAHTWWGGVVPNTYTRSLWNESFAEYSDGLFGRQTGTTGLHEFNMQAMTTMGLPTTTSLLEARDAADATEAMIGYGKGSLVLENLERMLGTPKMLAAMRKFIANHEASRKGEDAEWPDFIDAVAQTAGEEWRGFFPSWLSRRDYPTLRLSNLKLHQEGNKATISGTIEQREPAFWMHVPLVIKTGSQEVRRELSVRNPSEPFGITVEGRPTAIALDPKNETLKATGRGTAKPTLLGLHTTSDALLVVYATGGSAAETSTGKEIASREAANLFPFAHITVRSDQGVTAEELGNSHVLLLGRTESLRLPAGWLPPLPLRYSEEGISLGSRTFSGKDLWGLVVAPHPTRKGSLLAHAAGVTPAGLRAFAKQADFDATNNLFIARGAKPLYSAKAEEEGTGFIRLTPE